MEPCKDISSLIASIIQAPYYYYGWILSYRNSDLFDLVGEITNSNYIENAHKLEKVSWIEISKIIHSGFLEEKDQSVEMYAKLWEKLAKEYLSSDYQETYKTWIAFANKCNYRVKNPRYDFYW